jgi:RHS repeat-associated protein
MKQSKWHFIALFVALYLPSQSSHCQVPATPDVGDNPYRSYSGGNLDHIQMQNGSLYLRIPLLSYPQKGKLNLSFSILANGSQWAEVGYCDSTGDCSYTYGHPIPGQCGSSYGYWTDGMPDTAVIVDQDVTLQECSGSNVQTFIDPGGQGAYDYSWNYLNLVDSSQAVHTLGFDQNNWQTMQATDGSGFTVRASYPNSLQGAANPLRSTGPTTVIDSHGNKEVFSGGNVSFQDPIGNTITRYVTSGSTTDYTIRDSAGRSIPDPAKATVDANVSPSCPNLQLNAQPVVSSSSWVVPGINGQNLTYHLCYTNVQVRTNFFWNPEPGQTVGSSEGIPEPDGSYGYIYLSWADINHAYMQLQSIVLPDGTYWGFAYDTSGSPQVASYGDLTQVILPTGGTINYSYVSIPQCGAPPGAEAGFPFSRAVQARTLQPLQGPPVSRTYAYPMSFNYQNPKYTIETDSLGNDTVHVFNIDYVYACGAEEVATKWYHGSSNGATNTATPLKEVDNSFLYQLSPQDDYYNTYRQHINLIPQTVKTYLDGALVETKTNTFDTLFTSVQPEIIDNPQANGGYSYTLMPSTAQISLNTPTSTDDGIITETTERLAATNPVYAAAGLLELPSSITIANDNQAVTTSYGYDELGSPQGAFGNQTSISRSGVLTQTQFNDAAMPCKATDGNGNATSFYYDSNTPSGPQNGCSASSGLYVTAVQKPTTGAVSHTTSFGRDFETGLVTSVIDENTRTTTYGYDVASRLLSVNYPDGGGIALCYTDEGGSICNQGAAPFSVITQRRQDGQTNQTSSTTYDGLGRKILAKDPAGSIVDTQYDSEGRVASLSNPHAAAASPIDGYTSYLYDPLGRKDMQCQPDNGTAAGQCAAGSSFQSWSYSGPITSTTDEAGNTWSRTTDARSRLVSVLEPGSIATRYGYDALDNLISVSQSGNGSDVPRTRSFTYNSLSRLITSTNPETGTICYGQWVNGQCVNGYDASGNLLQKTDASGINVSYTYDALNRMVTKYSGYENTSNFTLTYDQGANGNGRLTREENHVPGSNQLLSGTQYQYDAMGRPTGTLWGDYTTQSWRQGLSGIQYDLAGNMTQLTYPDGTVVSQSYDGAGRLSAVNNGPLNGGGAAYLSNIQYFPSGALASQTLSDGVTQAIALNNRLQPCHEMASSPLLAASGSGGNLFDRELFYAQTPETNCGNAPNNNGNIWSVVEGPQHGTSQSFAYDSLNRLAQALSLNRPSSSTYSYGYNYDSFGNMTPVDHLHTPQNFGIDAATNRLTLNGDVNTGDLRYNANGTLAQSPNGLGGYHQYQWTGEGYLRGIDNFTNGSYLYNSMGQRTLAAHNNTTWNEYVYLNGQPMAEVDNNGVWTDSIYANGQKIASLPGNESVIQVSGNHGSGGNWEYYGTTYNGPTGVPGYVIQAGDQVHWRQFASSTAHGGVFLGASPTGYSNVLNDTNGEPSSRSPVTGRWEWRTLDLSPMAGGSMFLFSMGLDGPTTGQASIAFADISMTHADGSVDTIFNGQSIPLYLATGQGATNQAGGLAPCGTAPFSCSDSDGQPAATHYYLADQVGTTQMELAKGGWPIWQGYFTPFGQEIVGGGEQIVVGQTPADGTNNRYKFTGKERDTESGLDYFGARYYASSMGRWMSPDPGKLNMKHLLNPQKWNKYAYVLNNPLSLIDPDGLEEMWIQYRAFIPQATVGRVQGDNRTFSPQENASSRVSVTMHIETDPAKNGGNPLLGYTSSVSATHNVNGDATAPIIAQAPTVTATQDANGNVNLNLQMNVRSGDAEVLPKASIRSDVNIGVNEAGTQGTVQGTISGSPAFETNFAPQGGPTTNLPLQNASPNPITFIWNLPNNNPVNKQTPIKQPGQPQ